MVIANHAWRMTETPPARQWALTVGADNEYIYNLKLGLGPDEIVRLEGKGVI